MVERTEYAPYGQVLNRPEHDGPGYTGHEEDAATGLTNMQARYDDKVIGRMLSTDPMDVDPGTGGNFNRYAYANDNPYRYTDPDGRCAPEMCHWPGEGEGGIGLPDPCQFHPCLATGGQAQSKQSSRPAGQCDETCDEFREHDTELRQNQRAAVHEASKEFAKQAGWLVLSDIGGRVFGKLFGGIARRLGFASEEFSIGAKIEGQMDSRGWSSDLIRNAINDPVRTVVTRDTRFISGGERMNDAATAYYSREGGYVVRNNRTGDIVQVSDRNDPDWVAPWDH